MIKFGSWVALVTPMQEDLTIDFFALDALVNWHIEHGTSGIVLLGTTGESPTITDQERLAMIKRVRILTEGKCELMIGTGHNNPIVAKQYSISACDEGADALLVVTPCYNRPSVKGLISYYETILELSTAPVVAYNVPTRTGCDLDRRTLDIITTHPRLCGLKEAHGDISRAWTYRQLYPNLMLFSGNDDTALPFMKLGGNGVISVTANIVPDRMAKMCALALSGQWEDAAIIEAKLKPLHDIMALQTNPIPCKKLLEFMGKIKGGIRPPLCELEDQYQPHLLDVARDLEVLSSHSH